jgi:hypothetical protein
MNLRTKKVDYSYSPLERKIFSLLNKKPKSTVDITDEFYGRKRRPYNARQSVLGALDKLAEKTKKNQEPFTIVKSARKGPHPVDFWIEK